eukprot:ANDGO_02230.mRNA.1 hypothetical protein
MSSSRYHLGSHGYSMVGHQSAHCGEIQMYVKSTTIANASIQPLNMRLPAVLAKIRSRDGLETSVAGVHLEPFREGAETRLAQVRSIVHACSGRSNSEPLIIIGDYNLREAETKSLQALGLTDAWAACGRSPQTKCTFNKVLNPYHGEDEEFRVTARYDRAMYRHLIPRRFSLIGDQHLEDSRHYLSDHFGILCDFDSE